MSYDVVVVGSGIAGLSSAVASAEQGARVLVVDRAGEREAGGNTRWTDAYLRLEDVYEPGPNFTGDLVGFSGGRTPAWYAEELVARLPETMEWIQGHGARFRRFPTYFINSARPRLRPHGGGEGLLAALRPAAEKLGVEFRYSTTALALHRDGDAVRGVRVSGPDGDSTIEARSVVIASGGFEGDPEYLTEEFGRDASTLLPIAPSVAGNRGEGIRMALEAGAAKAGQWDSFHAEPVDPRSGDAEAVVMVFPYGILVNSAGERFLDEGRGTVDEIYEATAREIWAQGGTAWFITDAQLDRVDEHQRGLLTTVAPVRAESLAELAEATGLPAERLAATVADFNAATSEGRFDWRAPDGLATTGLEPAKSNWALPLVGGPFRAWPVSCAIVFTFGGLATDRQARVVREDDSPIDGLYAAGECTGLYHDKYPGGTSVLRGMIFGRIAGHNAAHAAQATRAM